MKRLSSIITHVAAAIIISAIMLCLYAAVQQSHRSAANDPQIQIAKDLSNKLSNGKPASDLLSSDTINLAQSLAPFTEIFDNVGKPLQSTGFLNGNYPQPPQGVFHFTNENDEDILTWQPQQNVRMAMVFKKVNAPGIGFIAVGRSLKETEVRENNLLKMIGITWVSCLGILLLHWLVQFYFFKRNAK